MLTDAQQRKTLAVVRSLGQRGISIMTAEDTRWATASYSKYSAKRLVSPNPGLAPERYFAWLTGVLSENHFDVLFPMDDDSMGVMMAHRAELEQFSRMPFPPKPAFRVAEDKGLSVVKAGEAGLDCPLTLSPQTEADIANLNILTASFTFPVLIKPRRSSGSRGITLVGQREDLSGLYRQVHQNYPFPLIQEFIPPGTRYDVCLLYDHETELRAFFVQEELRHFPLDKGPSTLQKSVWRPDLVEQADRLLRRLDWVGVAEVEFMIDCRDGRAKFMEINPRFWGSLYLSILSGVDFPWLLYQLAMNGKVPEVMNYRLDVMCKWSLPADILHFLFNPERLHMNPPLWAGKRSGVYDDILSLNDPLPVLGFILAGLHYLPDRRMWKMIFDR